MICKPGLIEEKPVLLEIKARKVRPLGGPPRLPPPPGAL
jgi:hypothetical protein